MKEVGARNVGFQRGYGVPPRAQPEQGFAHERPDQVDMSVDDLLGQGEVSALAGNLELLHPEAIGARFLGGSVVGLALDQAQRPLHRDLLADVGARLAGHDTEEVVAARGQALSGSSGSRRRLGLFVRLEVGEEERPGEARYAARQTGARLGRRRGLAGVDHVYRHLFRGQGAAARAYGGGSDGELALLHRHQLVMPGVILAHEAAPAAHLDLGRLARLLDQYPEAAEVGWPVILHAAAVDRQGDLEGERLAQPNGVTPEAGRERRSLGVGGACHQDGGDEEQSG